MTNYKKKRIVGFIFTGAMIAAVTAGVIVFLITHLDAGVLYKYSKKDSEDVINKFVTELQRGNTDALDYVWYHKDSGKMVKELSNYENSESEIAVSDARKAYQGLETLLKDTDGNKLLKRLMDNASITKKASKVQKVRKRTFIEDASEISYMDYGHTALYFMYESTVNQEKTQFDSIKDFNKLFGSISESIPLSASKQAFYLVPTKNGLKVDAYLFLKALGIDDVIYTGKDASGNVSCASVGGISIATDYTTTDDFDHDDKMTGILEHLADQVVTKDLEGLASYVSSAISGLDGVVTGQLGNLISDYYSLDEKQVSSFKEGMSEYEEPKCLKLKNSSGFSGVACLLRLKNSYSEPVLFIDTTSVGDNVIKMLSCTTGIYDQLSEVMESLGVDGNGKVASDSSESDSESSEDSDADDDNDEVITTEDSTTEGDSFDDSEANDKKKPSKKKDSKSSDSTISSNSATEAPISDNGTDSTKGTTGTTQYTKEEQETIRKNEYSNEEEKEYFEGDGTFGGEDDDPALVDDPLD